MHTCTVCGNDIADKDPAVLFVGRWGDKKALCSECEQHMDAYIESDTEAEKKAEIDYFYGKLFESGSSCVSNEVIDYFKALFGGDEEVTEEAKQAVEDEKNAAEVTDGAEEDEPAEEISDDEPKKTSVKRKIIELAVYAVIGGAILAFGIYRDLSIPLMTLGGAVMLGGALISLMQK